MNHRTLISVLLLLGTSSALGCAPGRSSREPVLVPASGTGGPRASSEPVEPDPATVWASPSVDTQLDLAPSGEQPTKLARPLPGAVPGQVSPETSSGLTGAGEIPGRAPTAREAELMIDQAGARITATRCEREFACQKAGTGPFDATLADCQRRVSADTRRTLNPGCTKGIDVSRIADCEREIRSVDCNFALDSLDRAIRCGASTLCNH